MGMVVVRHRLVVLVGVSVMHVVVWCGPVHHVGRVAHVPRPWWPATVMEVVGVAPALRHWEAGVGGGGVVVVLMVV